MIKLKQIGIIHTPFAKPEGMPIQPAGADGIHGTIELFEEYHDGLKDLEGFSHIFLLYTFHCSSGFSLRVKPFLDHTERGLFATRYPCRPNPIGISVVRLLSRKENILTIEGVDVLDNTPLLDIKPYVPDFDVRTDVRVGWYETRSKE